MQTEPIGWQPSENLEEYLERIEKQGILGVLEANQWNRSVTAKQLGITLRALRYRLIKLALEGGQADKNE